jgi:hypothetical protein
MILGFFGIDNYTKQMFCIIRGGVETEKVLKLL